jgi:adenylosuccinate synthase
VQVERLVHALAETGHIEEILRAHRASRHLVFVSGADAAPGRTDARFATVQLNGTTGLCITKLDVLDGLPTVRLCTGYRFDGTTTDILPFGSDEVERCEPVYEDFAGWQESTFGVRDWNALPLNARRYLERLSEVAGVRLDLVSTGPDRDETIVLRHPFAS